MPPGIKVTKEQMIEAAYQMTRKNGFESVTARRLAKELGCSTQPIFRVYPGMDALKEEVREKASAEFNEKLTAGLLKDSQMMATLQNVGMTYLEFAVQEKNLFRMLFLEESPEGGRFEDMLYGRDLKSILLKKEGKPGAPVLSLVERQYLFMQMWIFAHGMASMAVTGDLSLDEKDIRDLLNNMLTQYMV